MFLAQRLGSTARIALVGQLGLFGPLGLLCLLGGAGCRPKPIPAPTTEEPAPNWRSLFNGVDLEGWTPKLAGYPLGEDPFGTFRVEDGMLRVSYADYPGFDGQFGHLFFAESFQHYRLRLEYRFLGEQIEGGPEWAQRNSGVMIHSQAPESLTVDQAFPVSIEAQFLGGLGEGARPTGNLCTPGTHVVMDGLLVTQHCVDSSSETFDGDVWVRAEIEVRGDRITHYINGEPVIDYHSPQIGGGEGPEDYALAEGTPLNEGYLALQAESHAVDFRRIEIQLLPPPLDDAAR